MPTDKQRRQNERRRLQRQLERRREREVRRRRAVTIVSIVGTLVVIGVVIGLVVGLSGGGSSHPAASKKTKATPVPTATSSSASTTEAAYPCTWTKSGTAARKVSVPPTTTPTRTGTVDVSVRTNRGALTFALDRKAAPCAVESFLSLAKQKYFNDTPCHRLTTEGLFVLQCGDPTGTGTGGPGYTFADELTGKEQYTRGVIAMANSGKNTNGSQFFLVYKKSQLAPSYTIFGTVTKGLGVVDKVAAAGTTNGSTDGKPKLGVTLQAVRQA